MGASGSLSLDSSSAPTEADFLRGFGAGVYPALMRRSREGLGLTQRRAAGFLGTSVADYSALESGEAIPSVQTWELMCRLFGWPETGFASDAEGLHTKK